MVCKLDKRELFSLGITFWILFVIQIAIALGFYKLVFDVENETPTESITPATDNDVEVY
jgi:hypothetical protein